MIVILIVLLVVLAVCIGGALVYPKAKRQPEVASEQELVGVGPESTKVDKDPSPLQG